MKYTEPTAEDYENIAEKVRSGEYFREARAMTDVLVNDAMAERYFYVMVSALALCTFLVAFYALQSLYPLSRTVPFVYSLNDVVEDMPTIAPLRSSPHQSVNESVLFFLAKTYIGEYEGYNISTIERNLTGIQHYSSPEVFANYQRLFAENNPDSPILKYQRHSVRNVTVLSMQVLDSPANTLEAVYEASVENAEGATKSRYRATLSYDYSGVELDQETGTVKPVNFTVKTYSSKPIQDNQ